MAGTWVQLKNQPTFSANAMNLLTDGTVLVQELATANWWTLSPDASGSYVNGTWSARATSHNGPTYYASSILPDGRFLIAGGEDNFNNNQVDIDAAEIYDPVANSWTAIATPGWGWIGDAPACMLPNGKLIMGSINDTRTAIYDYATNAWTAGPNKNDAASEETWTLLPDGTVLVAEVDGTPAAEKYVSSSNSWVSAGSLPVGHTLVLSTPASTEIGPAILLPNGTVFAIGASGHTAIYSPPALPSQPGTWTGGPDFPNDANGQPMRAFDAPAVLLPNGKVLCIAGPAQADGWAGNPSHAYEFDGTNLDPVPDPPNAAGKETWMCRLLLLPTGEVLCSTIDNNIQVYQPDGVPNPAWAPGLVNPPASISPGSSFTIQGALLNGLSQANSYGDDAQMATNFPIVRLTASNGQVYYCRTSHFSTMGVATGATVLSATVAVPSAVPLGSAQMCVVANGIATCVPVAVSSKIFKSEIKEIKDKEVKLEKIETKEIKDAKNEKLEKAEIKEHKDAKIEKLEKAEIKEHKDAKIEKLEKAEIKEHKDAKIEKVEVKEVDNLKQVGDSIGKLFDGVNQIGSTVIGAPGAPAATPVSEPPRRPFIEATERPAVGEETLAAARRARDQKTD